MNDRNEEQTGMQGSASPPCYPSDCVPIDVAAIRWDVRTKIVEDDGDRVVKLSWGWTAGLTDEEIADLADDCPKGHDFVLITRGQALDLIARLAATLTGFDG